jgi:hypothetical protein
MPNHKWSFSIATDSGGGPVDALTITGPAEINIGNKGAISTFQVGVQDVVRWSGSITVANLISFFMEADTDVRVRINSEVSPVAEFNILAKQALGWNNQDLPHGVTNPLTGITTVTDIYVFNTGLVKGVQPTAGLKIANFQAGFLLNQEVVFS